MNRLTAEFPGSPRVQCLEGILKEANEGPKAALRFYEQLLEADPSNAVCYFPLCDNCHLTEKVVLKPKAIWKRQISVLRKLGEINRAVEELSKFVDTFYTDVEAWLELADIYASQHQCAFHHRQSETVLHIDNPSPDIPRLYNLYPTSWC